MNRPYPEQIELLELNLDQIRVLSSSACSEVFSAFSAIEPLSAREVGNEVGRSAAAVHEHVDKLLDVGLIVPVETRKRRSRVETLYVHKGLITRFVIARQNREALEAYADRFKAQMRLAERQFASAMDAASVDKSIVDFLAYKWVTGYLDKTSALRLKEAINQIQALMEESRTTEPAVREEGEYVRVIFSSLLLPVVHESRKRSNSSADTEQEMGE